MSLSSSRNGRSPSVDVDSSVGSTKSTPDDSGVEGLYGTESPSKQKPHQETDQGESEEPSGDAKVSEAEISSSENRIPEDSFETKRSRILFDAIDNLQSWGSNRLLNIPQGTRDSYRIRIEESSVEIEGMEPAPPGFKDYKREGGILTPDEFVKIVEEVSSEHLGIRRGTGSDKKNFASEVLRVELTGPNRSYFSVLDLPGIVRHAVHIKDSDPAKIEKMVIEYMRKPENIVVLVFVQNRISYDPDSFDLDAAETTLFGAYPWNQVDKENLGSKALKASLSSILDSKIRECFPALRDNISEKLRSRQIKAAEIGDPRDSHPAQRQYVFNFVQKFKEIADKSLDNPGYLDQTMEIKLKVKVLREYFVKFMRMNGANWDFEDDQPSIQDPIQKPTEKFSTDKAGYGFYAPFSPVANSEALQARIKYEMTSFQVDQLPGIINPNVYHRIFQLQAAKWTKIADLYLRQVRDAVGDCIMAMLDSVCPSKGSTQTLRKGLEIHMQSYFDSAYATAEQECRKHCKSEAECEKLQTEDPKFAEELAFLRRRRFIQAGERIDNLHGIGPDEAYAKLFNHLHWSLDDNMVHDVHDVVKVYYQLSLESFIRQITNVAKDFVSGDNSPLRMLNPNNILQLSDEQIGLLALEDDSTQQLRDKLTTEISKLKKALDIVDTASRRTQDLKRN
ncbi:hypothetical protein G7Z17_g4219 [Cylindrodendrum hubeiense]|uniref:GED domain-containing protein n=1 Tax=Cylindrodendrum hubeiense TaxID=595255 RepID=A0A9P5HB53_9HYPO|nr:hypothetical protein G7Z17_g4219 [Cylindrodendrum hubeiense]